MTDIPDSGFVIVGPFRVLVSCENCDGFGIVSDWTTGESDDCPHCHGAGCVWHEVEEDA